MALLREKIDNPSASVQEIDDIEDKLLSLSTSKIKLLNLRDENVNALDAMKDLLDKYKRGEIFSISDHQNPEFEKHGKSQEAIASFLGSRPYILSYENTMKIVEYAQLISEKDETERKNHQNEEV